MGGEVKGSIVFDSGASVAATTIGPGVAESSLDVSVLAGCPSNDKFVISKFEVSFTMYSIGSAGAVLIPPTKKQKSRKAKIILMMTCELMNV